MPVQEIAPGLVRWTAPHPDWRADAEPGGSSDWPRLVGSVLYELEQIVVLIDPLLPLDGREECLGRLDSRIGARPVSILTTIHWHIRDRALLAERYRGRWTRAWNVVPRGVVRKPLRGAGETLYWLPGAAALVSGDRLIGDGRGGLQVCPQSWLADVAVDRRGLALLMRGLLELPIERVLVSHGDPVLSDGRAALARALGEAQEAGAALD
ncbi:MAG TPA: hypothetical protein VKG82_05025 [Solirubrobacteraceae bacterium]|nr:hypothetical protein [Solirubrobacteraceae bacterium]